MSTSLAATEEWQKLTDDQWREIFAANHVGPVAELHVETEAALLSTLDEKPLSVWKDWTAVVPLRIAQAREEAVRLLEPKAVRVQLKSTTLHTPAEVETYLQDLRVEILQHIVQGNPVIL